MKGIHHSPATEFYKGQEAANKKPLGSITVRKSSHGNMRRWVKLAEPNVWKLYAIAIWEQHTGQKLPKGCVIHHRDRDSLNDSLNNLICITRSEHINEHRHELKT